MHDSIYSLYITGGPSFLYLSRIALLFRAFHLHHFLPRLGRDVRLLSVIFKHDYPLPCIRLFHHYLGGFCITVASSFHFLSSFLLRDTQSGVMAWHAHRDGALHMGLTADVVCSQTVGEHLIESGYIISAHCSQLTLFLFAVLCGVACKAFTSSLAHKGLCAAAGQCML